MVKQDVTIVEVGPRDGLQNIKTLLSLDQKINLIQSLLDCGFNHIEAGSFVRADKIPSMADTPKIADHFAKEKNRLWYLVPNLKGCEMALAHGATQLAFFTAASDTFNQKNIGMTTAQSVSEIKKCLEFLKIQKYQCISEWDQKPRCHSEAKPKNLPISTGRSFANAQDDMRVLKLRLYISTVIACPYEGKIKPEATFKIMEELFPCGFSQVSLGDTIGIGMQKDWETFFDALDPHYLKNDRVAMHCHDTHGRALSCVEEGLKRGVRTFDSSIGGLGGCPFAPGAPGNLATEALVSFLEKEGFKTGINLEKLKRIKLPVQSVS